MVCGCLVECVEDVQERIETDKKQWQRRREWSASPSSPPVYSLDESGSSLVVTPAVIRNGTKRVTAAPAMEESPFVVQKKGDDMFFGSKKLAEGTAKEQGSDDVVDENTKRPKEALNNLSVVAIIVALYFFVRWVMRFLLASKALHVALLATLSVIGTSYALPGAVAVFLAAKEVVLRQGRAMMDRAESLRRAADRTAVDDDPATPSPTVRVSGGYSPDVEETSPSAMTTESAGSFDDALHETLVHGSRPRGVAEEVASRGGHGTTVDDDGAEGVDSASLSRWKAEGESGSEDFGDETVRASGVRGAWNASDSDDDAPEPTFKNTVRKLRYDADVRHFDIFAFHSLVDDEEASIWALGHPSRAAIRGGMGR